MEIVRMMTMSGDFARIKINVTRRKSVVYPTFYYNGKEMASFEITNVWR